MNNVVLSAKVVNAPVEGGIRFDVTGQGEVVISIRRMVMAHAAMLNGFEVGLWRGTRWTTAPL